MASRLKICAMSAALLGLATGALAPATAQVAAQAASFDFGDDTSEFAHDGECDDIRFEGSGMAQDTLTDNIGRDASDCREAYNEGTVTLNRLFVRPASNADIIFGDDTSEYARDDECDDIRFVGSHSATAIYLTTDVGRDATDCKAGFDRGALDWQGHLANPIRGLSSTDLIDLVY